MTRLAGVALVVLSFACSSSKKEPTTENVGGGVGDPPATVTLVEVSQGDVACYVTVAGEGGAKETHPGVFELCPGGAADASAFVGFPVQLTWGKANLMAASCEGN